MTNNQKKSLVDFYLSKYNDKAIEKLGYKKITEALNDLSERLKGDGKANSFIKRRRDEFDVFLTTGAWDIEIENLQMVLRICIIDGMSYRSRNYMI